MTEMTAIPQGDLRLLDDPIARRLLDSTELGRLAYTGHDGAPRVIPVGWLWTGEAFVFGTFLSSPKVRALRRRPAVALTIDRFGPPPDMLLVRGTAAVDDVAGVSDEYVGVQEKYFGPDQAAAARADLERGGARMARVTVRPSWVGVFDFQTRVPGAVARAAGGAR